MPTESDIGQLPSMGVLRFSGPDAVNFLQGQLSNDLQRLSARQLLFAGLHNPQGRVIALLLLTRTADTDVIALLPAALAASVAQRLRRFVLRARVTISDESGAWSVTGATDEAARRLLADDSAVQWPGASARVCLLQPMAGVVAPEPAADFAQRWQLLNIADGIPRVDVFNSEQYIAQMLNLDCIDAVSFDKGCYTGQEIIARAHYRGRVKRRMQRFLSASACTVQAGDSLTLRDGRDAAVVDALLHADGRSEFLAVATWPLPADLAECADGLRCTALPLPYGLPQ